MKSTKWLVFIVLFSAVITFKVNGQEVEKHGMGDMFVHPFLTHMALPDHPGEMSLRLTPFQERNGDAVEQDLVLHLEAGLLRNLGLHIRSEGIKTSSYSEEMLMYRYYTMLR